jgi:hypothetical protein
LQAPAISDLGKVGDPLARMPIARLAAGLS